MPRWRAARQTGTGRRELDKATLRDGAVVPHSNPAAVAGEGVELASPVAVQGGEGESVVILGVKLQGKK